MIIYMEWRNVKKQHLLVIFSLLLIVFYSLDQMKMKLVLLKDILDTYASAFGQLIK